MWTKLKNKFPLWTNQKFRIPIRNTNWKVKLFAYEWRSDRFLSFFYRLFFRCCHRCWCNFPGARNTWHTVRGVFLEIIKICVKKKNVTFWGGTANLPKWNSDENGMRGEGTIISFMCNGDLNYLYRYNMELFINELKWFISIQAEFENWFSFNWYLDPFFQITSNCLYGYVSFKVVFKK